MSSETPVPSQLGTSDRPSDAPPPKPSVPETPRKRKPPVESRLPGIRTTLPNNLTLPSIRKRLKKRLKLTYTPDDWQIHLIRRLLQGYDSILCAGTGYGKSLIFEGLAALGGKGKCVVIISPLKALERDQASQAKSKGLDAVVLNEDTTQTRGVWEQAKKHACLIYASPEMALAPSFQKLWRDAKFRGRLLAIAVDEAHCVEEWGDDSFRPAYRRLSTLRHYTGQDVPFLACTATCSTSTFKTLWDTLSFGSRPFWGLDVGVERNNLLYSIRELVNTKNPVLDVLNILPLTIDHNTTAQSIPKSLFYFSSENDCQLGVRFLRNCLPASIRQSIQAFSSTLSEGAKAQAWDAFLDGRIRILCATDAAGMGCNVSDVQYVVSFGIPKTVGQVCQRWGRGGRDRTTQAVCILLVPAWSIRPDAQLLTNPLLARLKGGPKPEPKSHTVRRAKLDTRVEHAINLKYDRPRGCVHRFFASTFRPATNLHEFRSLDARAPSICGAISESSPYELSWTVLDLGRKPSPSRCCHLCNASELDAYKACDLDDPRLKTFAHQFLYPLATPEDPPRPSSSASDRSDMSTLSTDSVSTHNTTAEDPTASKVEVSVAEMVRLESLLVAWRKDEHERQGGSVYLSAGIYLPPRQVGILADAAENFANMAKITVSAIRKLVRLDMLNDDQVSSLSIAISNWKRDLPSVTEIARTPKSVRHSGKRAKGNCSTPISRPALLPLSLPQPTSAAGTTDDSDVFGGAPPQTPEPPPYQTPRTPGSHYRPDYVPTPPAGTQYYRPRPQATSASPSRPCPPRPRPRPLPVTKPLAPPMSTVPPVIPTPPASLGHPSSSPFQSRLGHLATPMYLPTPMSSVSTFRAQGTVTPSAAQHRPPTFNPYMHLTWAYHSQPTPPQSVARPGQGSS